MTKRYPVSFAQQRLWFLEQLTPGQPAYHIPCAMRLRGPLDAGALQAALDRVVARHAVLRTTIAAVDGVPEQVVADRGAITLERVELPPGGDAKAVAVEAAKRPFDLARGPLIRAVLVSAGPDEHVLMVCCHHVVGDAWSLQALMREVSAGYRGEPDPPPLPLQYGDFAVWQAERLSGEALDRQLAFWREHLRGAPSLVEIPTVHSRPPLVSYRGWLTNTTLSVSTVERLDSLARRYGVTTFMVLLAGFAVVVSRYARQREIVIATPVAGRTHTELEPMIGLFVNTLALRTSLAGDPTFADVLARVRAATADALSHQELPFEKLVEELAPERSLAHAPLCQVGFTYLPDEPPRLDLPGIEVTPVPVFTDTSKFDISLYAEGQATGELIVALEYSTDLFDLAWADRFLSCLVRVLDGAVADPDARVVDLPLVADAPLAPGHTGPEHGPVLPRLRGSTSVVSGPDGTYAMPDVCAWAARLARVLREYGVGPDRPVGLHVERGVGLLAGLLAVWWAGGAYVPLDPDLPRARRATIAAEAGVRVVLGSSTVDSLPWVPVTDPGGEAIEPVEVSGRCLAYVISTSGSTGRPKGVAVEHAAVANLLGSFARAIPLSPSDCMVAVTTIAFDIALLELLLPLVRGARLVIAGDARDGVALRALLDGATALQATPQTWRLLLAAGGVPDSVRWRLCGGEALPRDLADSLSTPDSALWNVYGPTETTVWSAAGPVGPGPIRIGPPIDHTNVYVLDERQRPVPLDVVGEVYLAGRGVARGYHGRGRLTASAFLPDPYAGEPGARMYRTGDLGRWRTGGGLELVGRTDHQVKVRGFRIECGEVEAVLRTHPGVRQAAVVAVPSGPDTHLVAYVVPRRRGALPDDLGAHLRTTLPEYMVPGLVVPLPALPLTANGKVDRAALPAPDWGIAAAGEPVAPRDATEAELARIWADLLDRSAPIGVHDSLFALGGHSITATRLVARVWDAFGVNLPVHTIFATPTIAELAAAISADRGAAPTSLYDRLDALSDEDLDELVKTALEVQRARQAGDAVSRPG